MAWTFETNATPKIELDQKAQGAGGDLLKWLKPTLNGEFLGRHIHWAPYGDATAGAGVLVTYGIIGLALYGAFCIVRRIFRF